MDMDEDEESYSVVERASQNLTETNDGYRFIVGVAMDIPSVDPKYESLRKFYLFHTDDGDGGSRSPIRVKQIGFPGRDPKNLTDSLSIEILNYPSNVKWLDLSMEQLACAIAQKQVFDETAFSEPKIMEVVFGVAKYRIFIQPSENGFESKVSEKIIPE
jgi:hypothetical protein